MVTLILSSEDRAKQVELPALKHSSHSIPGTDFKVLPLYRLHSKQQEPYRLWSNHTVCGSQHHGCWVLWFPRSS